MAQIKKELLEQLIRTCVREVLDQVSEVDDTVGAPAPPAGGLGTAEQPAMSQDTLTTPPPAETQPQGPTTGIVLVDPKDPAKLMPVELKFRNDQQLERDLQRIARSAGGPQAKRSLKAIRDVKAGLQDPSSPTYLYIGKYDPESTELFLLSTKDLNVAKSESASPDEVGAGASTSEPTPFDPTTAGAEDFAQKMSAAGGTPRYGIDELKKEIKKIVREVFSK